ncbi:MAG TPA: hypothetical protein VEQ60_01445 [Longimicrobium sp.]|nr:hypothetical protein [Longimicrobium sp.]
MRILILAAAIALAACSGANPAIPDPVETTFLSNGLEQEIKIRPMDPQVDPRGKMFHLTSRLVNRSDAPVTVRVVTCWLDPKVNLRTRATFIAYAIPGCIQGPSEYTLAPGEASNTLWFTGEIERPGRYTIEVRHALDPEFWGKVEVVAR